MNFYPIWISNGENYKRNNYLYVDDSYSSWGYIRVWSVSSKKNLKLLIKKEKTEYAYDLNLSGEAEIFPLQMGDGRYNIKLCRNKNGKTYEEIGQISIRVSLMNEFCPFLCPSQYVNYNEKSECVIKAFDFQKETARETISAIKNFMKNGFVYDYIRAITQKTSYIGIPDECLQSRLGLCLDFSSLFAAMARSCGIPTKVVIGYLNKTYHAWNSVYIDGKWLRLDITSIIQGKATKDKVYKIERVY